MSVAENIEHYFAALERQSRRADGQPAAVETLPFVTISRQAGAGAGAVAAALLRAIDDEPERRLFDGWRVLDHATVDALQRHDGEARVRTLLGEDYHTQIGEFVLGLFGREAPQDTALLRQSGLLRSLAAIGRVIIVGHGASRATTGLRAGVHLRLIAPLPLRARRLALREGVDESQAAADVGQRDRGRARLLKNHYRVDIDDPLLYDATFNTAHLSAAAIAAATLTLIKQRAGGGRRHDDFSQTAAGSGK